MKSYRVDEAEVVSSKGECWNPLSWGYGSPESFNLRDLTVQGKVTAILREVRSELEDIRGGRG